MKMEEDGEGEGEEAEADADGADPEEGNAHYVCGRLRQHRAAPMIINIRSVAISLFAAAISVDEN